MTDYVKSTNFTSKDSLSSGNPLKIVKGTEIDIEFNDIATAIATKANLNSPALIGTPTAPTASYGTSSTQISTTAFVQAALQALYPVGSIYSSTVSTNPNTLFGFGTWVAYGAGRVLVGDGSGFTAGATGGSADAAVVSHTHTATSSVSDPGHLHGISNVRTYAISIDDIQGGVLPPNNSAFGGAYTAYTNSATTGIGVSTSISSTGSSGTNANLQPYVVVYMWNRTA